MPRTHRLALLAALLCASPLGAAEDPPPYKIILPTGEAHELLPKTCGVCHKDANWRFFVVAAPAQEGLDKAFMLLKSKGVIEPAAVERAQNAHAVTACLFCHLDTPKPGDDPEAMNFRTLDGSGAALREIQKLCEMCHPSAQKNHARVLSKRNAAAELAAAGLPVRSGQVVCSTCHDMHGKEVGPANVRKEFLSFSANNPGSRPHGNKGACRACHPSDRPTAAVFLEDDPTKRCLRCHPEGHPKIHASGVMPTEKTYPMAFLKYPTDSEGRITCSTCHDHPCAETPEKGNPSFLRGGPYNSVADFCYRCHPKAGLGGINPHDQVDAKGNIVESVCTFCHKTPPSNESYDPEELLYVRSMVEICARCHDQGPHPSANHLVEMSDKRIRQLREYEKRHKVTLPLDPEGRIVCTTCHNPHDKGVLRDEAALGAGEQHKWRVPSFAELCTPCHARYD